MHNCTSDAHCSVSDLLHSAHVPVIARFTRKQLPNMEGWCFASGQFAWKSKSQSSAMQNHLVVNMAASLHTSLVKEFDPKVRISCPATNTCEKQCKFGKGGQRVGGVSFASLRIIS